MNGVVFTRIWYANSFRRRPSLSLALLARGYVAAHSQAGTWPAAIAKVGIEAFVRHGVRDRFPEHADRTGLRFLRRIPRRHDG
jgi:hypothetical protein